MGNPIQYRNTDNHKYRGGLVTTGGVVKRPWYAPGGE